MVAEPQQALPAELQRALKGLDAAAKEKLLELHKTYGFSDDTLESFTMNSGGRLTADQLPAFEQKLMEEAQAACKQDSPGKRRGSMAPVGGGTAAKRRRSSATPQLPRAALAGVSAALALSREDGGANLGGLVAAAQAATAAAPGASGAPGGGARAPTKEPARTPIEVSLKVSVNNGKLEKTAGAGAPALVKILGERSLWTGRSRDGGRDIGYEWMDEALEERAARLDDRLAAVEGDLAAALCARQLNNGGSDVVVGTVGIPSQQEVVLCGRIACEGLEGKLNERAILLEGSRASGNASMRLVVSECPAFAAFPGQIVGVVGRSGVSGTTFHAKEFWSTIPRPLSAPTVPQANGTLHMMVAVGPFCLRAGLDYSPLMRVIEHAVQQKPAVLLLVGPFLDASNQQVLSGSPILPEESEPCSFEEVYSELVVPELARGISLLRQSARTEVLVVPSLEETMCLHPMPQPPLTASLAVEAGVLQPLQRLNVQFLPNPAHLDINGHRVSVAAADALSPLLRELVLRPEGKKIEESLRQILNQRNLFPVLPRDPPQVSEARAAALEFPDGQAPDVVVFPSQCGGLSASCVENTAFVNPGFTCRPAVMGTFAECWLAPKKDEATPMQDRIRVDVMKLATA
eukprot:TRINITY_DN4636_c0_g1_i1.p1 TRINITY_DN4636_c0_g1~~TRINITY_DN4636_c0_g1_i1.p1  ORF type:complete len:680 (-),score=176.68 TRINITY_DN4636_c0_g1_i1:321-2219(-)